MDSISQEFAAGRAVVYATQPGIQLRPGLGLFLQDDAPQLLALARTDSRAGMVVSRIGKHRRAALMAGTASRSSQVALARANLFAELLELQGSQQLAGAH